MAEYELSKKADEDLNEIYRFSYRRFGEAAADTYLLALERRFSILAAQPVWAAGSTVSAQATSVMSTPATPSSTG
jgi:plasmid stabilization system protein ParE